MVWLSVYDKIFELLHIKVLLYDLAVAGHNHIVPDHSYTRDCIPFVVGAVCVCITLLLVLG